MSTVAEVRLWGSSIGAVSVGGPGEVATFEYTPAFQRSGIEVAPLMMPLAQRIYSFPDLPKASFHGLPGLLADALPDKFGNLRSAEMGLSVGMPSLVIRAGILPSILVRRSENEFTCPRSHAKDMTTIGMTAFRTSDQFIHHSAVAAGCAASGIGI